MTETAFARVRSACAGPERRTAGLVSEQLRAAGRLGAGLRLPAGRGIPHPGFSPGERPIGYGVRAMSGLPAERPAAPHGGGADSMNPERSGSGARAKPHGVPPDGHFAMRKCFEH